MGVISESAGLGVAMTGAAVLSIVGAVLVVLSARALPAWSRTPEAAPGTNAAA
jgi:hypothetical protein